MIHAVQIYLQEPVVMVEDAVIKRKKMVSETSIMFEGWVSNSTLNPGIKYDKRELYTSYTSFCMNQPDCDQSSFTRYLKSWAMINNYEVEEPRSDDIRYIRFLPR
jgi:hypothetical protein